MLYCCMHHQTELNGYNMAAKVFLFVAETVNDFIIFIFIAVLKVGLEALMRRSSLHFSSPEMNETS